MAKKRERGNESPTSTAAPPGRRSSRCQLGILDGCEGVGRVQIHLPDTGLYCCYRCLASDLGTTAAVIKNWIRRPETAPQEIHRARQADHDCPAPLGKR